MNLSERLKALGVRLGAEEQAAAPRPRTPACPIEQVLPVELLSTSHGEACALARPHPAGRLYGVTPLAFRPLPELLAAWARAPILQTCAPKEYLFFDTETTGLSGGSGTYAFLIGAGRFEGETFCVRQFFLREPGEEAAQLAALAEFAAGCRVWVSFNGRSFDGPLLETRCTLNGLPSPLEGRVHLDLLLLARRLWRERLPSRSLLSLETAILGASRSREDIPGWVIPRLYLDYLHTGDARLLKGVFYHNEMDILAMAALLNHMGSLLDDPLDRPETPALDLTGIGGVFEKVGRTAEAARLYAAALHRPGLPEEARRRTRRRLSFLLKRAGRWEEALRWWRQAAEENEWYACEELAKFYEHRARDLPAAQRWTRHALSGLERAPAGEAALWRHAFEHRLARLERKAGAARPARRPPSEP